VVVVEPVLGQTQVVLVEQVEEEVEDHEVLQLVLVVQEV
jgi:hypothetical protein